MSTTYELEQEQPQPQPQPYSVKLEATRQGYRIHVHVYAQDLGSVRYAALMTLRRVTSDLKAYGIPIAPMIMATSNNSINSNEGGKD